MDVIVFLAPARRPGLRSGPLPPACAFTMTMNVFRARAAVATALLIIALPASAASRQQVQVDALNARMQAAESRFGRASAAMRNDDPAARHEADAALEDMEDVMNACIRLRGCPVNSMLATYKRLLKQGIDADAPDDADDPLPPGMTGHEGIASAVPEAAHAASLLSEDHRFDRMVQYNPAVQEAIRRWLTDMRGALLTSYENYQTMRHLMWPEFQREALPEALLFGIVAKESNGRVHATSRAGASGPMQFMPATGRRFGLGPDGSGFDTRYDPRMAAMASADYLNERMGELNRSIELSLAAYNGGEGRALRVYQGSGGRSFWEEPVYNQFPAETRDYVPMVIGAAWLFLHAKEYGLTLPKVDTRPAPLRLLQSASVYQLTICLGNRGARDGYMRALRNLNPRYEADAFIPAGATLNATTRIVGLYNQYCTGGRRAELARALVTSVASRAVVRTGPLQPVDNVGEDEARTSISTPIATGVTSPVAMEAPRNRAPAAYQVQGGETLMSIARKFGCRLPDLARTNSLQAGDALREGQILRLDGCDG